MVLPSGESYMANLAGWMSDQRAAKLGQCGAARRKWTVERERALNSIGFIWNCKVDTSERKIKNVNKKRKRKAVVLHNRIEEERWTAVFHAIKKFKDEEGRWPKHKIPEDKREVLFPGGKKEMRDLACWMTNQRKAKLGDNRYLMTPSRERMLNKLDFPWSGSQMIKICRDVSTGPTLSDLRDATWEACFDALRAFKETEGRWPKLKRLEDEREVWGVQKF